MTLCSAKRVRCVIVGSSVWRQLSSGNKVSRLNDTMITLSASVRTFDCGSFGSILDRLAVTPLRHSLGVHANCLAEVRA